MVKMIQEGKVLVALVTSIRTSWKVGIYYTNGTLLFSIWHHCSRVLKSVDFGVLIYIFKDSALSKNSKIHWSFFKNFWSKWPIWSIMQMYIISQSCVGVKNEQNSASQKLISNLLPATEILCYPTTLVDWLGYSTLLQCCAIENHQKSSLSMIVS